MCVRMAFECGGVWRYKKPVIIFKYHPYREASIRSRVPEIKLTIRKANFPEDVNKRKRP